MLVGLIRSAVEMGDAHDDQFADIGRQSAFLADGGEIGEPALGDRRAVQQHLVEVQHAAALGDDPVDELPGFGAAQVGVGDAGHRSVL
jgi:hypothetical protein